MVFVVVQVEPLDVVVEVFFVVVVPVGLVAGVVVVGFMVVFSTEFRDEKLE